MSHARARPLLRRLSGITTVLWLAFAPAAFAQLGPVALKEVTHSFNRSLPHLEESFQLALVNAGWVPLTMDRSEATAEIRIRSHAAKVRIRFADGRATFTLIESINLDQYDCDLFKRGVKVSHGPCIHENYYAWIEDIMDALPMAQAHTAFLKSQITERR
jgi:hypothetical protein